MNEYLRIFTALQAAACMEWWNAELGMAKSGRLKLGDNIWRTL